MTLTRAPGPDPSRGYDAHAAEFMRRRNPVIGAATVRRWAASLPPGSAVLDLGCGHGDPISTTLVGEGLLVHGIDASPLLIAAFRRRLPRAIAACERVEHSRFFERSFGGVVAWGLLFLLDATTQEALIRSVATALDPGGRFLFTAPREACGWTDSLTGLHSLSLGANRYRAVVADAGLEMVGEEWDEGDNHYYDSRKRSLPPLERGGLSLA